MCINIVNCASGGLILSTPFSVTDTMGFELPELEYAYDALEPHIDAETMELHHSKHHAGYTANLNAAIDGTDMESKGIEELMVENFDNAAVRNNGGGLLDQAVNMVDLFIHSHDTICFTKGKLKDAKIVEPPFYKSGSLHD